MTIDSDDFARIDTFLNGSGEDGPVLSDFRKDFPDVSLTRCDASDMIGEEPFKSYPKFNLYLVDGRDHCWHITSDPSSATGIVLAQR